MVSINEKVVRNKIGLLKLAEELSNVSKACQIMGVSRDTFYRYKEAHENGGIEALFEKTRRKPNLKNRVDEAIESAVVAYAVENPAHGQVRASNELRQRGIFISPYGARCVWLRHGLATFKERLLLLEKKVAEEGLILTERQIAALEKKNEENQAQGEIETQHPGYLVSQDTFYVGTLKGVGRIYQQTVVDTYSKVAFAKLYPTKTPITAADTLNDKVIPCFEEHGMGVIRMLTDRGTEYCGCPETHDYQLFLAVSDIEHTKTKARHPQTNGICERFHKTILNEFYQLAFRKKIYPSIEALQNDLDTWIHEYNAERTHQGKYCFGRTPWQTFLDGREIWNEKVSNLNAA
jgi:transposase InsO family protein